MPHYIRLCMLDLTFRSVDLDEAPKFPGPQCGMMLPDGSLAFNGLANLVKTVIENSLAGRRTEPEWFHDCTPRIGNVLYRDEGADVWFIPAVKSWMPCDLEQVRYFELTRDEATAWLQAHGFRNPCGAPAELPDLVTLDQAAAAIHKSKRTLERCKTAGTLPLPAVDGGGGKADLYDWKIMRPWLTKEFGVLLPERFPRLRQG
jgi:hypothetical protein